MERHIIVVEKVVFREGGVVVQKGEAGFCFDSCGKGVCSWRNWHILGASHIVVNKGVCCGREGNIP